jgi:hypothetical protein
MVDNDLGVKVRLWRAYADEVACPGSIFSQLQPEAALRKACRDCRLNPTRSATCLRFLPRVRRARRAPHRQRGCRRASAGGRDDGGGDGSGDPDPAQHLITNGARLSAASERGGAP